MTSETISAPAWRGFHHVAVVTPDLDATIHFYGDILGMQVGAIMDRGGRHCFIQPGDGDTRGLHVFEHTNAQIFSYPNTSQRMIFLPGFLQHIAFALPDESAAMALRERLAGHGIEMTPVNSLGTVRNFLFRDNNGNLLEAAWDKS